MLTSCLCKILEKNINSRFKYFLERHNLISEIQFGFRKKRCTVDALAKIETDILNAFEHKKTLGCHIFRP